MMKNIKPLHWSILREYDIRGVVGETLNIEDARLIGQAFGTIRGHAPQLFSVVPPPADAVATRPHRPPPDHRVTSG